MKSKMKTRIFDYLWQLYDVNVDKVCDTSWNATPEEIVWLESEIGNIFKLLDELGCLEDGERIEDEMKYRVSGYLWQLYDVKVDKVFELTFTNLREVTPEELDWLEREIDDILVLIREFSHL